MYLNSLVRRKGMSIEDLKILITDDSILARKQLKDIISTLGSPVFVEATDGQNAIDKYKEEKPDLVFLDIVMPKKDGNAAIQEIMEFDSNANIIIASSVGTQSQLKKALEAGAKDFIQKPLDKDQVIRIVKKFVEGR
jgi:two-component system chemotaxis response regulator CheY